MKNKKIIGFFLVFLFLLMVELIIYLNYNKFNKDEIKISFVVTGENLDEWENMKSGAVAAAADNDCSIDFVNTLPELGAQGEQDTILRCFSDGADYVVVATNDYDSMISFLKKKQLLDRVFLVKNGVDTNGVKGVLADDTVIGSDFADYIAGNFDCKNMLIVSSHEDINTETLRESLEDSLDSLGIKTEYRLMSSDPAVIKKSLYNIEIIGNYDGIITLDYLTMEGAAIAKQKITRDIKVFSVDNSQEAVYYLDSQGLDALAFKDDYSMGYLSVKQIIDNKEYKEMSSIASLYYIADRNTMHNEELEKVLFPFVK